MRRVRAGISTILVEVLIISLTLIMVSLAVTWILGLWHSTQETFMIKPMVRISFGSLNSTPVLQLYVTNNGEKSDIILKVMIKAGEGYYINSTQIKIPAGFSGRIVISKWVPYDNPKKLVPGDMCRVYIYTANHGMLFYDLIVSS